jgi:hypothetical protein
VKAKSKEYRVRKGSKWSGDEGAAFKETKQADKQGKDLV